MKRPKNANPRCFRCGGPEGRSSEVGDPAFMVVLCPPCVAATGAKPYGSAKSAASSARFNRTRSVWSAPPARYPVCRNRDEFIEAAIAAVGQERAAIALAMDEPVEAPCEVPVCGRPVLARGLCGSHYKRRLKAEAAA